MRFMMLVKANEDSEAGVMPSNELIADMTRFNEEMVKAGVMLDGAGLHPSSKAARVRITGGPNRNVTVIDGPFAETKELIAGYWIIQAKSFEEALEWAKRVPAPHDRPGEVGEIEVRQFFELEDFEPSEAIDRARALEEELARQKK